MKLVHLCGGMGAGQPLTVSCFAEENRPYHTINIEGSKVTSMIWGPYDESIITGHENGTVKLWDLKVW